METAGQFRELFRNAGARITDEIELELGVLWGMAKKLAGDQFPGFGLAIVKHTDCGFERLANPDLAGLLSQSLNVDKQVIDDLAIRDHTAEIQADLLRLQKSAVAPRELVVSGHIYDVHTGLMQEIVAPSPLQKVEVVRG